MWNSFDIADSENVRHSDFCSTLKDAMDCNGFGDHSELMYEVSGSGTNSHKVCFSLDCVSGNRDVYYSIDCIGCSNCFLTYGLTNASYCILNKQYMKEEYETLVPKIIEHMTQTQEWGEFFPVSMSPFAYNESVAQLMYPIDAPMAASQ